MWKKRFFPIFPATHKVCDFNYWTIKNKKILFCFLKLNSQSFVSYHGTIQIFFLRSVCVPLSNFMCSSVFIYFIINILTHIKSIKLQFQWRFAFLFSSNFHLFIYYTNDSGEKIHSSVQIRRGWVTFSSSISDTWTKFVIIFFGT